MKNAKKIIVLFLVALLPVLFLSGCFKPKIVEYSLSLKEDTLPENISYEIGGEFGTVVREDGKHIYEKDTEMFIDLRINIEDEISMMFDEDLLKTNFVAISKIYDELTEEEYITIKAEIEAKIAELQAQGKTREEAEEYVKKLKKYEPYVPLSITWTKVYNEYYKGK